MKANREEKEEEDKKNLNIVDLKKWKHKSGQFNQLMLNTCPVMPPFHSKHGEPVEDRGF